MAETIRDSQPLAGPETLVPLLETMFDQASLAALRREVSRCGAANGLIDLALSNFVLAVNEIATNAVRYAGGRGELRLWREGDDLWCRVVDNGPGIPRRYLNLTRRPAPDQIGGHGLWLARHICASVDIETDRSSGTRVLLRYTLPAAGP
jgi:serine/threonine-protein kinase RsbW